MKATNALVALCLVLAAAGAVGCTAARAPEAASATVAEPLAPTHEQVWQLVEMRGRKVERSLAAVTLVVNPQAGTVKGQGACNGYYADCRLRWTATDQEGHHYSLRLENVGSHDRQCPDAEMNADARYLALLAKADGLVLTPTTLVLFQKERPLLKYELL